MRKIKKFLSLVVSMILVSSCISVYGESGNGVQGEAAYKSRIIKLADTLYQKYKGDVRVLDGIIITSTGNTVDKALKDAEARLLSYCVEEMVSKYTDRIKGAYKYQEYEPVYPLSDTIIKSRMIELSEKEAVVRQFRSITDPDTEWGGKGRTYNVVRYIFLQKDGEWKLKDIVDTRSVDLEEGDVIVDSAYAEVTGDYGKDEIYLIARKGQPEDAFASSIKVIVNYETYKLDPGYYAGYEPGMRLAELNGDGVSDIYIAMGTGGSSGASLYYVFTLRDGEFNELMSPNKNTTGLITLNMSFIDN